MQRKPPFFHTRTSLPDNAGGCQVAVMAGLDEKVFAHRRYLDTVALKTDVSVCGPRNGGVDVANATVGVTLRRRRRPENDHHPHAKEVTRERTTGSSRFGRIVLCKGLPMARTGEKEIQFRVRGKKGKNKKPPPTCSKNIDADHIMQSQRVLEQAREQPHLKSAACVCDTSAKWLLRQKWAVFNTCGPGVRCWRAPTGSCSEN